jgi:hypothetical protein
VKLLLKASQNHTDFLNISKLKTVLKTSKLANNTAVKLLVQLWAQRYVPDLSTLFPVESLTISKLLEASSKEGRAKTVTRMEHLIQTNCDRAGLKTHDLFSYIPNVVNLDDARRLADSAGSIYLKALDVFWQQSPNAAALTAVPMGTNSDFSREPLDLSNHALIQWAQKAIDLPAVEQLAVMLEPFILRLQEQHLISRDLRTIGFISTQFHFTSELALKHLTLPEQVLLKPYFKFIEEQTCIPWQRVCAAAAKHEPDSSGLAVIRRMLPMSRKIAETVYNYSVQLYPKHRSRRGGLNDPWVKASTIRDMEMLQSYLWLCVLEESMTAVERELIPLCVMVFPSIDVKWEFVARMTKILMDEVLMHVEPKHKSLVLPYAQIMQELFSNLEQEAREISKGLSRFVAKEKSVTTMECQKEAVL